MTLDETKQQIIAGLNNNSIQILVQRLAEVLVENEKLKADAATAAKPQPEPSLPNSG